MDLCEYDAAELHLVPHHQGDGSHARRGLPAGEAGGLPVTPFVQGFLLGAAVGAAMLKALELIAEEIRRLKAYERTRKSLKQFIQGE